MPQSLTNEEKKAILNGVTFLVGSQDIVLNIDTLYPRHPFDEQIIEFLNSLSKILMTSREAKAYPDVITLGFWMRKSAVLSLKERFIEKKDEIRIGRGTAFHIAPSNVPVNYAYSLLTGLLTGNANIVRIPSKDFPQVSIINNAINETLNEYQDIRPYICLVRYGRDQKVNDLFSALADTRITWGGDNTIAEIRKSPLGPRAGEIAFADRYSLSVIDSDKYLSLEDKTRFAEEFYNDTYLTDQNACTSPRLIVWVGSKKKEAKEIFWNLEHDLVKKKYPFQSIIGINKLTSSYLIAAVKAGTKIEKREDNYIVRVNVPDVKPELMEMKDNSGYFFEYDCDDLMNIRDFCNNTHCQTIGYLGDKEAIMQLLQSGIKGGDRVVPIGKTMDFDFIWDGYNLVERLTRTIKVSI